MREGGSACLPSRNVLWENIIRCSFRPPVEKAASSHHALLHPLLGCAHLNDATWNASVRAAAAKPRNPRQILSVKTRLHVQRTVSDADWNVSQAVAFFRPLTLLLRARVYACMHTSKQSYMHKCLLMRMFFTRQSFQMTHLNRETWKWLIWDSLPTCNEYTFSF